ncbi:MAG: hypothetical protein WC509_07090 [Candidatus Izemoplasmatales bacterium]
MKSRIRMMVIIPLFIIIVVVWILYVYENTHLEQTVATFAALGGLVGIYLEFRRSKRMAEAEFITRLNTDFNQTDRILGLYEKLEAYFRHPAENSNIFDKTVCADFVVYLTFFETLYNLISRNIIGIDRIHDLFAYRFFIMVNNPIIQKIELEKYDYSYVNIFKLYRLWLKHAYEKSGRSGRTWWKFWYRLPANIDVILKEPGAPKLVVLQKHTLPIMSEHYVKLTGK